MWKFAMDMQLIAHLLLREGQHEASEGLDVQIVTLAWSFAAQDEKGDFLILSQFLDVTPPSSLSAPH
jgi:hypothetical protein